MHECIIMLAKCDINITKFYSYVKLSIIISNVKIIVNHT